MEHDAEQPSETGPTAPPTRRLASRLVFAVVLLLLEGLALLYQAPLSYPDELSHLQHAQYWAEHGHMPDPYAHARAWEREGQRPAPGSSDFKVQQDKHPPYAYALGALLLRWSEGSFAGAGELRLPGAYELEIELGRTLDPLPVHLGQTLWLRVFSALHWLAAGFAFLLLAERLFPRHAAYAFALALGTATVPQALLGGVAFTPDTPLIAFCAWSFYFVVRGATGAGRERGLGLLAGLFLALALLSKSAAIWLVPVILLAGVARARELHDARAGLRFVLWCTLLPLVLASWWYVRNWLLYGDLFQMRAQLETYTHSMRRTPLDPVFFEVLFEDLFRTFFGFGTQEELLPRPFYYLYAAGLGIALLGLLRLAYRRAARARLSPEARVALPLALLGASVMLTLAVLGNLSVPSAQGRYLFPALPGFLVLVGLGLFEVLRPGTTSRAPYLALLAWIAIGLVGFVYAMLPRAGVQRDRAAGEGAVHYYLDCGSPGELDRFAQSGTALPDPGQLGRVEPWRTLRADPLAVVYELPRPAAQGPLQLRITYFNPDLSLPYSAEAAGRFSYPSQSLWVDSRQLSGPIEVSGQPKEFVFPLPTDLSESETLRIEIRRESGSFAMISELWLEDAWLQLDRDVDGAFVRNRSTQELTCELLYRLPGEEQDRLLVQRVPPRSSWRPAELPASAEQLQLWLRERSPWRLLEAEGHPAPHRYWFGALAASGGYVVRGEGPLVALPAEIHRAPPAHLLLREFESGRSVWRALAPRETAPTDPWILSAIPDSPRALDFVILCGVRR